MIHEYSEKDELRVLGKIRLGVRKKGDKGDYPLNVDYFVVKDAPDVERVYGPDPKELDGYFLSDVIDEIAPAWWKLYGQGLKQPDGSVIGGKLKCYGTGPYLNGAPGEAFHLENKINGVPQERKCLGLNCPDAFYGKNQACKKSMSLFIWMPHCNPMGVYQIDTTSKIAIDWFTKTMKSFLKFNGGNLKQFPFKFFRTPKVTDHEGKKKVQYILDLRYNGDENDRFRKAITAMFERIRNTNISISCSSYLAVEAPMEDHWPAIEAGKEGVEGAPVLAQLPEATQGKTRDEIADEILANEKVSSLFNELEKETKAKWTIEGKRRSILKKINEPDPIAAVCEALEAQLLKARTTQQPVQAQAAIQQSVHQEAPIVVQAQQVAPAPTKAPQAQKVAAKKPETIDVKATVIAQPAPDDSGIF